jgi:lipopolysaccharide transport system ATP-binding protein
MDDKEIAIKVEGLGKRYRLGRNIIKPTGFGGKVRQALTSPFEWLLEQNREPREDEVFWALKDINFEIARGEVVGFIGHNGAGKSTLLKILSRITEPTTGYAEINGRLAALLEVGTGMHPELTGRENIYMNGTVLGMKKREIDTKFDEIVDFSGVSKFLDTPVKHYSSGMRVRLGFAIAAHLEPEILVIDEVLAVGDAAFQEKCLDKMQDVARGGRTVLFVSHNMAAIENLCSKAFLLNSGSLIYDGDTRSVINKYLENLQGIRKTPIHNRLDRRGNGEGRFVDVRFINQQGREVDQIACGQNLTIAIHYEGINVPNLRALDIHVTFFTNMGQFMFNCTNAGSGFVFAELPRQTILRCQINKLPLTPGKYTYNLYSTIQGHEADWIQHAGSLTVIEGDFFGSGKIVSHRDGFLVEQRWGANTLDDTLLDSNNSQINYNNKL